MFQNIYNMSDEEIEKLVDDYLNNTPKDQLFEDFEKAGLFEEFADHIEDINWEIFLPYFSSSNQELKDSWNVENDNSIQEEPIAV